MSELVNVLYVEDNEGDVEIFRMSLERYCPTLNIVLDIAETVEEAKKIYQQGKYVIALIDCNLPDGEGIDVIKFIREKQADLPIFLLSGVITLEHIEAAETYNPIACLEKDYGKPFFQQIEKCILSAN
jgi:two-component system response regulator PilR (NtrC family)